ncbi:MAG: cysteine hydrolase [Chloroflexi bacterium AL-W]|nr:cysteine hydrolase [Chloroflexi bacterium AL-N1]NOK68444.1 cysteine hydrolase [Chloroflexi bacterium AL-N10]NOK74090.1 cysteine hydrolase [Chloroflexi bacterium AL-N5]NOK83057.1 cysteine hydrolase [Chloroflexi bacterium AL-W]NOK90580.1 cysteine hydrolase [Chloroflexi bacterium AL-N15]
MKPAKRALLIIDVQNEYSTGNLPVTYPSDSLGNILRAMDAAIAKDIPVIVVQHAQETADAAIFRKGSSEWALRPEVACRHRDLLVEKRFPGSFTETGLETWLQARGIDTVVIAGYMAQACCDTTARQAYHRGFDVEFLSNATDTLAVENSAGVVSDRDLHQATMVTHEMFFSRVMTMEDWMLQL